MFTRRRFQPPRFSGDWRADGPTLLVALTSHLDSLEQKDSLCISEAQIHADEGIQFPATQAASSDPNNLDDYEEGNGTALEWTPVLTFATPGDLALTYSIQIGTFTKIGRVVIASFRINTSAFSFTTATGNLQITGLPFPSANVTNGTWEGAVVWGGITKAGYTQVVPVVTANTTAIMFTASGSGVAASNIAATDTPTGSSMVLRGTVIYHV
jgi:hypothetical protein